MLPYRISKKAVEDLKDIGRYTQHKWGISQRNKYLKQIHDSFLQLTENPNIGFNCDFILEGYRKFPQGSHIIFYKIVTDNSIEIIRILHKSMDVESKFYNA
jgi:toxin ParE1/3/4